MPAQKNENVRRNVQEAKNDVPGRKSCKALAKMANIAQQTLLFVSESLAMDRKVTPNFRREQ